MDPERPPDLDAEYRVIHGPWPRWVLQFSLLKLALRTAGIVVALCLVALLIAVLALRAGR
ncbi:MAG: hypothetical protein ACHP9T_07420 [Caulobacterales bacterium]|jgi:hypothetical protein